VAALTGRHFFPTLIGGPFHHGLVIVFTAAALMSFIGAMVSLLRGRQFIYDDAAADGGLPLTRRASSPAPPKITTTINGTNGSARAPRLAPDTSAPVPGTGRAAPPD
jgi:hypothetical protein